MKYIVLAVLLYILYRLIKKAVLSKFNPSGQYQPGKQGAARARPPITDELVKDPVCGTYVPRMEALTYFQNGKIYYFCCKKCLEEFAKGKDSQG